jgi:hypothetical protein
MKTKPVILSAIVILFLCAMVFLFYRGLQGAAVPPTSQDSFSNALWGTWGVAIVIISFVIFAGGAGILVLLGGGWRWE